MSEAGQVGSAVETALKEGYLLVDCAHVYENEAEIGVALKKCFTDGVVKREAVFITSKLWYDDNNYYYYSVRKLKQVKKG